MTSTTSRNQTSVALAQAIAARWSPRGFDPRAEISDEDLAALGEAARWAPSAMNLQPTKFIVARRGTGTFDKIAATLAGFNQAWAPKASALVVALAETSRGGAAQRWAEYDLGQAVAHLSLEATHRGLITHQMGGFDADRIRSAFALSDDYTPVTVIAVGRHDASELVPADIRDLDQQPRSRRGLDELTLLTDL